MGLFSVALSEAEMAAIRAGAGEVHGLAEDGERTYTEVRTVRELLAAESADWSTLGMILSVLAPIFEARGGAR